MADAFKRRFSFKEPLRRALHFGRRVLVLTDIRRPESWLSTFVSLLLRTGTLVLIAALMVLLWRLFRNDGYVIEAFSVPKSLEESGFQGQVVARMIQDELLLVKAIAASVKSDSLQMRGDEQPELNVAVMGFGVSLRSIAFQLRELFGRPNNVIRGELTLADSTLALTLRMTGFQSVSFAEPLTDGQRPALQKLLRRAGECLLGSYDPYRLAVYYNRENRLEEGIRVVGDMLARRPEERHWAYLAWGALLEGQGKLEEALLKFEDSAAAKTDFALPWMRQAWLLRKLKRNPEAIEKTKRALELAPGEPSYWGSYANLLNEEKRYEEADRAWTRMTELVGWREGWQMDWAEAKLNRGDLEGGKQLLQEIIAKSENDLTRTLARAFLGYVNQDFAAATQAVLEAYALDPNNGFAVRSAQLAYLQQGNPEKAIELGTRIRFGPNNAGQKQMILNYVAMAYNMTGRHDSAFVYARQAIAVDSAVGYPYSTLGETYAFTGNDALFYFYLEKALQKGMNLAMLGGQDQPYLRYEKARRWQALLRKYGG